MSTMAKANNRRVELAGLVINLIILTVCLAVEAMVFIAVWMPP
jgi:hypothetical protein